MGRGHCSAKTCYVVKCETYFAHDAGSAEVERGCGWMEIGMEMGQEQEGVTGDAAGAAAENCKRNQQQKFPFR